MDSVIGVGQLQQQEQPVKAVEKLNSAVQQQLNLESVKTRAVSLFKAITRILEDFDIIARTNAVPKWENVLGQFSMVNLELYNIVEDIKKVSKAFVVHPKNVNAENAAILPVMISSKLLPEIEADDNSKREQLLYAMQNLSVPAQIERLKARIDMIGAACESAEKVIADTRKTYFGTRQGPTNILTLDKAQAAKIQEQENSLRQAVNLGQGLRLPMDQRQITSALPAHLMEVLPVGDNVQTISESSGMYMKNTLPMSSNAVNNQGVLMQASGSQMMGRAAASPGAASSFDNTTASPLPYANSPRSAANMLNIPSPQQQTQQQQQQLQQQQQRQRLMQLPQHQQQQMLAQYRQSPMTGMGQNNISQLHDLQGQVQHKYQLQGQNQMQFSPSLGGQQFQGRQLTSGGIQHGIAQNQLNQGNQMNRLNQMSSAANSALFNAAQATPNNQMMSNMSSMMPSQTLGPRMQQFGLSGGNRTLGGQNLTDQVFNMGAANQSNMMPIQQQQQQQQLGSQGGFGNMQQNNQNLQPNMVPMQQNPQQNFQQHRQNQQ